MTRLGVTNDLEKTHPLVAGVTLAALLVGLGCSETSTGRVNRAPEVSITSHNDGAEVYQDYPVQIEGIASDMDDDVQDLKATWYFNGELLCAESAPNSEGRTSCAFEPSQEGTGTVTLDVRDPDGATDSASVELSVNSTPAPKVEIVEPSDDDVLAAGEPASYELEVTHPVEGPEDIVVWWSSDRHDDPLTDELDLPPDGDGGRLLGSLSDLATGTHILTAHARSDLDVVGSAQVKVEVVSVDDVQSLVLISGDGQGQPVDTTLEDSLVVEARNEDDDPLADIPITWSSSGPVSLSDTTMVTGEDGQATVTADLGTDTGPVAITAAVNGADPPLVVHFVATAHPGPAEELVLVDGDQQSAEVGTALEAPLVVEVRDGFDNPVPAQGLSWEATGNAMVVSTSHTNLDGRSEVVPVLGTVLDTYAFTASLGVDEGQQVSFEADALPLSQAPSIVDAWGACDGYAESDWEYWLEVDGWAGEVQVRAAHTDVDDPAWEWYEAHPLAVESYGPLPGSDEEHWQVHFLELEYAFPSSAEDWEVGKNTFHFCQQSHVEGMSWLYEIWDLEGNLADCAVGGLEPGYAFGDDATGCALLGEPLEMPEPESFQPHTIRVAGEFAYDATADQIVHYQWNDQSYPPALWVEFADEDAYFGSWGGTICRFLLTADDQAPVEWEHDGDDPVTHLGFLADLPSSVEMQAAPDNIGDCDEWADGPWGDDPEAWVGSMAWGLGVGPFHSDVEAALQDMDADQGTNYATTYSGGGWHLDLLVDPEDPSSTGYLGWSRGLGFEGTVDGDGNVVVIEDGDGPVQMSQAEVDDIGNWGTGVYWTGSLYIIQIDGLFDE